MRLLPAWRELSQLRHGSLPYRPLRRRADQGRMRCRCRRDRRPQPRALHRCGRLGALRPRPGHPRGVRAGGAGRGHGLPHRRRDEAPPRRRLAGRRRRGTRDRGGGGRRSRCPVRRFRQPLGSGGLCRPSPRGPPNALGRPGHHATRRRPRERGDAAPHPHGRRQRSRQHPPARAAHQPVGRMGRVDDRHRALRRALRDPRAVGLGGQPRGAPARPR